MSVGRQPGVGRLERIDRVFGIAREIVADFVDRVEIEVREVAGTAEQTGHRGGKSK